MIVEHVHAAFFFVALVVLAAVLLVIKQHSDPEKELSPDTHGTDAHEDAHVSDAHADDIQPAQTVSGFQTFLTEKWSPLLCSVGYALIEMVVTSPLGGGGPWRGWMSLPDWSLCASSAIVLSYALWLNRRRVRGVRLPHQAAEKPVTELSTSGAATAQSAESTEAAEAKEEN
jgi:predicted cobalt transporter CbtA